MLLLSGRLRTAVVGKHLLACLLTVLVAVAWSGLAVTPARAATAAPCASPTISAVNQYCEDIPCASGQVTAAPGMPGLAGVLPRGVARRLSRSRAARSDAGGVAGARALLALPAPSPCPAAAERTPTSSPLRWLVVVLAVITLAMTATALARRRRGVAT